MVLFSNIAIFFGEKNRFSLIIFFRTNLQQNRLKKIIRSKILHMLKKIFFQLPLLVMEIWPFNVCCPRSGRNLYVKGQSLKFWTYLVHFLI